MKKTSLLSNGLLWFGAAVSIAEIFTGSLFAPLGFWKGFAAIILGHAVGCTLSSAIACNLAAGFDMQTSVKNAKAYITDALKAMLDLGKGSGPLDHCFNIK